MNYVFLTLAIFIQAACYATYYGQCGQDQFIHEKYFKKAPPGVFVDIGAHSGIYYSNTYFFEKECRWTGICVEPIPEIFSTLRQNRHCICVQGCVSDRTGYGQLLRISSPSVNSEMLSGLVEKYDPRHVQRILKEIQHNGGSYEILEVCCYLLNDLLAHYGIRHINFLSIDTEGSEYDIIQAIDFSKYQIDVIMLEDNYQDARFVPFLKQKGYHLADKLEWDLVFVHKDFHPIK